MDPQEVRHIAIYTFVPGQNAVHYYVKNGNVGWNDVLKKGGGVLEFEAEDTKNVTQLHMSLLLSIQFIDWREGEAFRPGVDFHRVKFLSPDNAVIPTWA